MKTLWRVCLAPLLGLGVGACDGLFAETAPACEGWRPGDAVITELLPDPEGVDTGKEWVELYNPAQAPVDLRGLLLYAAREDGSQERAYLFEESVPVRGQGYVVLGDVRSDVLPAHVDHSYGAALGALGNTGGRVGLRCGDVLVDEVRYTRPGRSGMARGYDGRRVPDALDNDEPGRWCDMSTSGDGGLQASPGAANGPCPDADGGDAGMAPGTCLSRRTGQSRSPIRPRPGDLLITEVMADPKAFPDAQGEWVELKALRDVDLNGVVLTNESGSQARLEAPPHCLEMRAGSHAVLAHEASPALNGGLPEVLALFSFGLSNSGGAHALRLSMEGEGLAEVTWTGAPVAGVSWQVAEGRMCLAPEGARYGPAGERGTPGEENRPCVP